MGLARSTDLNSYICKRKGRKIMGLSRSTHLVSHNSITGISRKIMGLARSTDLNLYWFIREKAEKSWVWRKVLIGIFMFVKEKAEELWVCDKVHI